MFCCLKQDKCQMNIFVSDTKSNFLFYRGFHFSHAKKKITFYRGVEKDQKVILDYPNYRHTFDREASVIKVAVFWTL